MRDIAPSEFGNGRAVVAESMPVVNRLVARKDVASARNARAALLSRQRAVVVQAWRGPDHEGANQGSDGGRPTAAANSLPGKEPSAAINAGSTPTAETQNQIAPLLAESAYMEKRPDGSGTQRLAKLDACTRLVHGPRVLEPSRTAAVRDRSPMERRGQRGRGTRRIERARRWPHARHQLGRSTRDLVLTPACRR